MYACPTQQQKEQRVSLISKKEVELIRVEWKFVLNTIFVNSL